MQIPANTIYPRTGDRETVYLNAVVSDPNISVGDYTIYNDFLRDPTEFVRNNVLYHYPINGDRLVIGKFCSIACGAKFLFTSANHTLKSLSTYPFPIFYEAWDTSVSEITETWDNRGTLSSAAMSGSAMRPSSSPACGSVTAPSWPPGRWWLGTWSPTPS